MTARVKWMLCACECGWMIVAPYSTYSTDSGWDWDTFRGAMNM